MAKQNHKGGCLCGGVRYEVRSELRPVVACHCSQCRRTSGNFVTATNCGLGDILFACDDTLRWYRSSDTAERGFCCVCGSNLFWRPINGDHLSIMAGTLDTPTGKVRAIRYPARFNGHLLKPRGAAPGLGEGNAELFDA